MFTPRYVKHSRLLLRHAQKYLRYKRGHPARGGARGDRDAASVPSTWPCARRRSERIKSEAEALDTKLHKLTPVTWEAHWRENCEVILVAIIVAIGIRSYFLQPFKIPDRFDAADLERDHRPSECRAGAERLRRALEFVILGRNYIDVVSQEDDRVLQIVPKKFGFFFTFSRIICTRAEFPRLCAAGHLRQDFKVCAGQHLPPRRGDRARRGRYR